MGETGTDYAGVKELRKHKDTRKCVGRKVRYYRQFGTFDIETTSLEDCGFMYLAAICIDDKVYMFRRWEEVVEAFETIAQKWNTSLDRRFVIYVHNLSFEFQFFRNFFVWDSIFAVKKRVVIKAVTREGIEFRCSYKLSNMSLDHFLTKTDGVKTLKQSGEIFDYSKIRTPDTPLSDYEMYYMFCDVKGLHEAIEIKLANDDLSSIPLTSTGYVRRDCRHAVGRDCANIIRSGAIDSHIYLLLRTARRGGDTSANPIFCGQVIEGVDGFDISSSYPYVMLTRKFPMGSYISSDFTKRVKDRSYILKVTYHDIEVKEIDIVGYISIHKALSVEKVIQCNGRVVKAHTISMVVTEVDFDIINQRYNYDHYDISECYSSATDFLPIGIRKTIISYFSEKTLLKGVDDYLYSKGKNNLNSIFGMMLTDICHSIVKWDAENDWQEEVENVDSMLEKYHASTKSFLLYQWGVYVTAYARERYNNVYMRVYEKHVYNDTDSIYAKDDITEVINEVNNHVVSIADTFDVKPYVNKNGKRVYMGLWEHDAYYDKFKTLGAKKYCTEKNGKCEITVAGLSKKKGSAYINKIGGIDKFTNNLIFNESNSGRTLSVYDDDNSIRQITVNGCTFTTSSSIAIHNTTYTLDQSGLYKSLLHDIKHFGLDAIS